MTVSTDASKTQGNGNGSTSAFPFSFSYTAKSQIVVVVTSAAGVDSTKTLDTHYTLSDPGDSGTVTFLSSPVDYRPQSGEKVTISRVLPIEQSDDFVNGQGFNSATIEAALDRITRIEQMLAERISRAPKLKATTPTGELTFPEPSASSLVSWNDAGTALVNRDALDVDLTTATALGASLLEADDAAAARTLISAQALDSDLTAIAGITPANDDIIQRKAGAWVNRSVAQVMADLAALGTTFQPLDADLTAIAALSTTSYGRALLTLANAAALTAAVNTFTSSLNGLAPASGGGTANFLRADGAWASSIVLMSAQAASGSAVDFTSIPAGARRISIMFDEVTLSGTDNFLIQIGDSGGIETTGYSSGSSIGIASTVAQAASGTGFLMVMGNASRALSGIMTLSRINGNSWASSHAMGSSVNAALSVFGGGIKSALTTDLDRVRITVTGANTFDGGTINLSYEL